MKKFFTLAEFQSWGSIGGKKGKKSLTRARAKAMVRAREAKRRERNREESAR